MVILPPRQIQNIYGFSEDVLDVHKTQKGTIQTKWTVWDQEVADNDLQINVVRHQLTRNLATLTPVIDREIEEGFKKWWGVSNEWHEVSVWPSCLKLIAGAANGAFCGLPLCMGPLGELRGGMSYANCYRP